MLWTSYSLCVWFFKKNDDHNISFICHQSERRPARSATGYLNQWRRQRGGAARPATAAADVPPAAAASPATPAAAAPAPAAAQCRWSWSPPSRHGWPWSPRAPPRRRDAQARSAPPQKQVQIFVLKKYLVDFIRVFKNFLSQSFGLNI